ncbi:MAG: phenylacetate--CoA ligase family protein [Deltaproteobacteria bacterium]|nr:phenylacetate--CoA ligase family protein [Deltaproteobacteria bacterium]
MSAALAIYHRLPARARDAIASGRGLYLLAWRYGLDSERLVAEALERDTWPRERMRAYQEELLARILHRAATRVPFYREAWARRRARGERVNVERLEAWPVLEKEDLRASPRGFIADDRNPRTMSMSASSGTSGTPVKIWSSREVLIRWYAIFDARCRRWYGIERSDPWAMLGGQLVVPFERRTPPFWVWNAPMRQLYMSSYHLSPAFLPSYLEALERYGVKHLLGYTSSLHALAEAALAVGRTFPVKVAIANAEPVEPRQRTAIERALGPVRETYGMTEMAAGASECEAGKLHLWPDAGLVEADAEDLICTTLLSDDMPLVRYRVGDRGRLAAPEATCACGRTLPILEAIDGRADDVLFTRDGRRIGRLDPVFKADLPIREAQIVQEALDRIVVRLVPTRGFGSEHEASIADRLRERLGDVAVVFEHLDEVPRTSSGKFRAVVSKLPARRAE